MKEKKDGIVTTTRRNISLGKCYRYSWWRP